MSPALTTAGNDTATLHADDHVEWTAYDLRGRPVFTVDGRGAVVKMEYDASGNVKATIAYATSLALSNLMTTAQPHHLVRSDRGRKLPAQSRDAILVRQPESRALRARCRRLPRRDPTIWIPTNQQQKTAYAGKPTICRGCHAGAGRDRRAAAPNQTANQTSTQTFDAGGRITQATDANGRSEYFSYDAVGNKIRYVNKRAASSTDAAYTWTFRIRRERPPDLRTFAERHL